MYAQEESPVASTERRFWASAKKLVFFAKLSLAKNLVLLRRAYKKNTPDVYPGFKQDY